MSVETSADTSANTEPTTVEKLRGLPWSIASNAANTIFVQFTFFGSVFVLFLSELGLSKSQMGFLLSLLPFSGLLALFVAPLVARFGYKRTYLTFFGGRNVVAAFLLLTPWVMDLYGAQTTLAFISVVVAAFALLRSIGVTASFPWVQEYVPNSVRGKYTATNNIFTALTGFLAVSGGGFVLGRYVGLNGFMFLIGIGVVSGLVSVWFASFIPGGAPSQAEPEERRHRDLGDAVRDPDFLRYLAGVGVLTLATVPLASFLPLFMQEQVGLAKGNVVLLQIGVLAGGLISSYIWGWAADRYGSKPVMLSGLLLRVTLPIWWVLMPRNPEVGLYIALAIALLQGLADMGWGIGSARLLYVNVVPSEKKGDYMALYYAWIGIVGGVSQLLGGRVLDASQHISGRLWFFILDPYLPLFVAGLIFPLITILLMRAIRAGETVSMGEFAGIFFRGNPFMAMSSLIRFHMARDEEAIVRVTERLGQTRSPLTVEELLEALKDPRFNVRFEAIISISRMPVDPRLIEALIEILHGSELALSVIAAWALGRIGDEQALAPLHQGLNSDYRSIRAHSARALGALKSVDTIPMLLERLSGETDKGLQMAYASALGKLQASEAVPDLLDLLENTENKGARMELALSVARIVGDEHHFIQLLRQVRNDKGTATSQAVTAFKRRMDRALLDGQELDDLLDECAIALARDKLGKGAALLGRVLRLVPAQNYDETAHLILQDCADHLEQHGMRRLEYVILALHTLYVGWQV